MCRVSDKIKLCTCNEPESLPENYWIFFRYSESRDYFVIGETVLPFSISPDDQAFNEQLLLELINEGNVFDTELNPKSKDRLLLSFRFNDQIDSGDVSYNVDYGFEYLNGKWQHLLYDPLEWSWKHEEESLGKILHPTGAGK